MQITLTDHAKFRCQERKIKESTVKKIVQKPDNLYFDTENNYWVAIKKKKRDRREISIAVIFDKIGQALKVISVFPENEKEIANRLERQRYVKI